VADVRVVASSLVASVFPHLALLGWSLRVLRHVESGSPNLHTVELAMWVLSLDIFAPAAMGVLLARAAESTRFERLLWVLGWDRGARTRTAWEWAFSKPLPSWLLITLRDGSLVGGEFGFGSFASLDPDRRDIFIARPYYIKPNRTFGRMLPGS
jgi:uncharacterized protein DUF6338